LILTGQTFVHETLSVDANGKDEYLWLFAVWGG
jgi:hypothetical protein